MWNEVKSVEPVEGLDVVAVTAKPGYYKTKAGMSRNCDDL